jgi:PhnB protein
MAGHPQTPQGQEAPMPVKPIPDGYHTATPCLIIKGAAEALEFYKKAFGAEVLLSMPAPDGTVAHAEMKIGNSIIMMGEEKPDLGYVGARPGTPTPIHLMLYVERVDEVWKRALAAGAREVRPLQNQFYGDRNGTLADPSGHVWTIATHVEDLTPEEIDRRMKAECGG